MAILLSITQGNLGAGVSSASGLKLKPGNFLYATGFMNVISIRWPSVQVPFSISVSINLLSKHRCHLAVVPAYTANFPLKSCGWGLERFKYIEMREGSKKQAPGKSMQAKNKVRVTICSKWWLAGNNYSCSSWTVIYFKYDTKCKVLLILWRVIS